MSKGFTFWFTGLSGAGKTTLSSEVYGSLRGLEGQQFVYCDGDEFRQQIGEFGYDSASRDKVGDLKVEFAARHNGEGVHVLISGIAANASWRKTARDRIENYREIYLKCPLNIVIDRDVKGLYGGCRGDLGSFVLVYEEGGADLVVDTGSDDIEVCKSTILEYILSCIKVSECAG